VSRSSWAAAVAAASLAHLVLATPASADEGREIEAASQLFEQGAEQQRRGDYKGAAQSFAHADELVPDPNALEAALRASMMADDAVLGMTLAERASRGPAPARLARVIEIARAKFAKRAGRLTVRCATCNVTVDDQPTEANAPRWLAPGDHEVVVEAAGRSDRRTVRVDAGSSTDIVALDAPPPPAPPMEKKTAPPPAAAGLSPVWFWVALGTTAAVGGATLASGLDTDSQHDAFERSPSRSAADSGAAAETRTNVLAGVTAALGLATATVGLFAVRWSSPASPPVTATLDITPTGALTSIRGRF
jgi:hypothetical protein